MYNSLKLYADNLVCMDLCCWSNAEAAKLLGSEVSPALLFTFSFYFTCMKIHVQVH